MLKVTVLYTPPTDPEAFEAHYLPRHAPLVDALPGLVRQETARTTSTPDGSPAPYYRTADLYFADAAAAQTSFSSPEGRAVGKDAADLAARTGCTLTMLTCEVD